MGQTLQVDHGGALFGQGQEQIGFATAGAAAEQVNGPMALKQRQNPAPKGFVSPLQQQHRQIQLPCQPGHAL